MTHQSPHQQQTTGTESTDALRQAFDLPLQQAMQFQQATTRAMLAWLEVGHQIQGQGIELTREAADTYLEAVSDTIQQTERAATSGLEATQTAAQQTAESMTQATSGPVRGVPPQAGTASQPQAGSFGGEPGGPYQPTGQQQTGQQQPPQGGVEGRQSPGEYPPQQ